MVMKTSYIFQLLISVCVLLGGISATAQNRSEPYETQAFSDRFRTIQTEVEGRELFPPIIELNTDEHITISFDELAEDVTYLQYSLIHCNADWRPSDLSDLEYLDGFNTNSVEEYEFSTATFAHYVHYRITLPMPMYSLKYRVIMCLWFILKTNRKIFCCKCVFRSMKTKFWSLLL